MKSRLFFSAAMALLIGMTGCAGIKDTMRVSQKNSQWNPVKTLSEKKEQKSEPTMPETMTVLWKESVFEKPGHRSVRGFGGRVFFHDAANNAVEADGELTIYGFDESRKGTERQKADKKFVFSGDELKRMMSDSGLGTSYNIWIPWDEVGGERKTIALIPMFRTNEEEPRVIKSGQSLNVLFGSAPDVKKTAEIGPYKVFGSSPTKSEPIRQAGYDENLGKSEEGDVQQTGFESKTNTEPSNIKTSTIRMTPSMSKRIAAQKPRKQETGYALGGSWNPESDGSNSALKAKLKSESEATSNDWISNLKRQAEETPASELGRSVFGAPGSFK